MKRLASLIIIIIALIGFSASAQVEGNTASGKYKAPDMAKIQKIAQSNKYQELMKRYLSNDPTLTLDEYHQVYFGFIYQKGYRAYDKADFSNELVNSLYFKENLTRRQCELIIDCAEKTLDADPFNLQQINYLIYAYRTMKKVHLADFWQTRLNNVLRTILSTGTGKSPEEAWHVIDIGHEYALIQSMNNNYIIEKSEYIQPHFDLIKIKRNGENSPMGFYFNIKYLGNN